jgi:hypothetical protein
MPITTRAPTFGGRLDAPTPHTTLLSPPWQHNSFLTTRETSVDSSTSNYCSQRLGEEGLSQKKTRFGTNVSLQEAALLLQEVASIASNELKEDEGSKLETQQIRKLPTMAELASSDVSDSPESRYVEDNNRFRTIRPSSSRSTSTPPGVLMAAPLGVSPMLPPFTLATHIVHTVSPTPRPASTSTSQPPIKPTLKVNLAHCNHRAAPLPPAPSLPVKKSKYVGTKTPRTVKGILKRKFSWKNYPDVSD